MTAPASLERSGIGEREVVIGAVLMLAATILQPMQDAIMKALGDSVPPVQVAWSRMVFQMLFTLPFVLSGPGVARPVAASPRPADPARAVHRGRQRVLRLRDHGDAVGRRHRAGLHRAADRHGLVGARARGGRRSAALDGGRHRPGRCRDHHPAGIRHFRASVAVAGRDGGALRLLSDRHPPPDDVGTPHLDALLHRGRQRRRRRDRAGSRLRGRYSGHWPRSSARSRRPPSNGAGSPWSD